MPEESYLPTPAQILEATAIIRQSWNEEEYARRSGGLNRLEIREQAAWTVPEVATPVSTKGLRDG